MKNLSLITLLVLMQTVFFQVSAQKVQDNPLYGADSSARVECAKNLSTVSEFMKINLLDRAYDSWSAAYKNCPAASKNIYIHGAKILKFKIENTSDLVQKNKFIDTLLMTYDSRIKYFGEEGVMTGRKGVDLLKYRKDSIDAGFNLLSKSIEMEKGNAEPAVIVTYMQTAYLIYKSGKQDANFLVNCYLSSSDLLNQMLTTATTNKETVVKAIEFVEKLFAESGAASCEKLVEIFTPKFEANPDDIAQLKKICTLLQNSNCEGQNLYAKASENLFKLEPSANSAYGLARLFTKSEDYNKAASYYTKAIELEMDDLKKSTYSMQLANITFSKLNNPQEARSLALQSIKYNSVNGDAYILIGHIYLGAGKSCASDAFEQATMYWIAVDKFYKAKNIDPSVTETANELIAKYSQYFPNNEDAFFRNIKDGSSYTVGCWINEGTTVRTVKK